MKSPIRFAAFGLLFGVLLSAASVGQSAPKNPAGVDEPLALVRSVRPVSGPDGPMLEIVATRPLVPTIRKTENPPRLVIDLPNTRLASNKKRIAFQTAETEDVRLDQFQEYPPIARIVIDLLQPVDYSTDANGNRFAVHLHPPANAGKPQLLPANPATAQSVAATASSAAARDATLDGNQVESGSSVTAGSDAAVVQLGRGGRIRVCPGTTVSVTPSKSRRSIMFGMSTGAMEAHYTLGPLADSIMTPDFRIELVGPGEFDYAVNADSRGNTCVQALPGNTASVIVSELMGDGTYQVKPEDHLMFHSGQLKNVALAGPGSCGCPAPERPVTLASSMEPVMTSAQANVSSPKPIAKEPVPAASATDALPASNPKDVHVQVDAPFVFRGDDPAPAPPPIVALEILPLRSQTAAEPFQATVLAPPKQHHGLFGKLRGFFAAVFG